jgi:hypothetical protein
LAETPNAISVWLGETSFTVELSDGRSISVPLEWYPRLRHESAKERENWKIEGQGYGIHWPDLDEDISVEGLLAGRRSMESKRSFDKWVAAKGSAGAA